MSFWTQLRIPTERELLVGFYDLAGYMRHAEKTPPQDRWRRWRATSPGPARSSATPAAT
jgi:hypothetical protein